MKPSSRAVASRSRHKPAPTRALTLATFLPYRLNIMAAVVSEGLSRAYSERFGIDIPAWRVLATVGEFRSITAKAIGSHARMGKVTVSRAAAFLEGRGFIRRIPNAQDRREAFLVLTPQGESVYGEIASLALAYVDGLTEGLSDSETAALDGLIEKLLRRAREMNGSTP